MIDAVLSYHLNPFTCGVAKFNLELAKRLDVPCVPIGLVPGRRLLLSVKAAELDASTLAWLVEHLRPSHYDLLLHDRPSERQYDALMAGAGRVFYADEIGCPSTVHGHDFTPPKRILTFGMAHKIQTAHHQKLKALLDASPEPYAVQLSTGVHEGSPWDTAMTEAAEALRAIYGDQLRVMGYLADDALSDAIRDAWAVAAFFDPAMRANNTTVWAALERGCCLITNLDEQSPQGCVHGLNVLDINRLDHLPDRVTLDAIGAEGRKVAEVYSWERLIEAIRA